GDDVAAQEVQRQVRVVAVVRAGVELDGMVAVHAAAASGAAGTAAGRPVLGGGDVADAARHGERRGERVADRAPDAPRAADVRVVRGAEAGGAHREQAADELG